MISYKRDVLERQSLSEVKMGRGWIVEYFKNNVPQCQIVLQKGFAKLIIYSA